MLSEDINATMNYSIMSTRSVITHRHTHAHTHTHRAVHLLSVPGRPGLAVWGKRWQLEVWAKPDKSADDLLN